MRCRRGRFDGVVVANKLYACGGSDGRRELNSIECFDGNDWKQRSNMLSFKVTPMFTSWLRIIIDLYSCRNQFHKSVPSNTYSVLLYTTHCDRPCIAWLSSYSGLCLAMKNLYRRRFEIGTSRLPGDKLTHWAKRDATDPVGDMSRYLW